MTHLRYSTLSLWLKYVNREPRVTGMCLGLLLGLILSPFTFLLASQLPYVLDGETVQGSVLFKHQAGARPFGAPVASLTPVFAHGKRGPRHRIRYEYLDAAGNKHEGEGVVPFTTWQAIKPGDPIAVRYVRHSPARSRLESTVWEFWPMAFPAGLCIAILAGSLWAGCRGLHWVNRQVRLVRSGEAVPGRLTRADVEHRGRRGTDIVCVLEYEYAAPDLVTARLEMRGRPRPNWQTGGMVVILIDPANPSDHAPDIFDTRAEDADRLFGPHRVTTRG